MRSSCNVLEVRLAELRLDEDDLAVTPGRRRASPVSGRGRGLWLRLPLPLEGVGVDPPIHPPPPIPTELPPLIPDLWTRGELPAERSSENII